MFLEIAKLKQIPEEIRLEILYIYLLFLAKKQSYLLTEGWLMIRCYLNKIQMTKICSLPQLQDLVIYPSFNVGIGIKSFVFAYVWLYPRGFIPKHQIFNLYKFRCHRSLETRLVPRPMASTLKAERLRASAGQASYGTRWLMTCKMACKVLKVKRPFKICNSERENKKGIVCSDLEDLKRISCEHQKVMERRQLMMNTFNFSLCSRGGLGGGTLGKCQGPRAFGGPPRADFFGPRGCLWPHVFRDRTAQFWADISYMQRGAGAPRFNIKYESRTFLRNQL